MSHNHHPKAYFTQTTNIDLTMAEEEKTRGYQSQWDLSCMANRLQTC